MSRILKISGLIALAFVSFSCRDLKMDFIPESIDDLSVMNFAASYPVAHTRATEAGFVHGDRMGIFVVDYVDGHSAPLKISGNRADNVRYTYNESSMSWEGSVDIYWKDKKTPVDIYGYYPFNALLSDVNEYEYAVSDRQDAPSTDDELSGYEASDFLWAKSEKVNPTSDLITLTYQHLMAGVKVVLKCGEGFDPSEWAALEKIVLVKNTILSASVDLSDGSVLPISGHDAKVIVPYRNGDEFRAVVVPQKVASSDELFSITVDGISYSYSRTHGMEYSPGKMHVFTIQVDKRSQSGNIEFSVKDESVTEWIDDYEFHDGILREYLVVDVSTPGTLRNVIEQKGYSVANISNLKVQGRINHDDLRYIATDMHTTLKGLNLKNAKITGTPEEEDVLKFCTGWGDVCYFEQLTHLVFPDKIKKIGNLSFSRSSLLGSIDIPEGVEEIGFEAFSFCPLTGTVALPSTLKILRGGAFANTRLRGNLVLPEGLQVIGPQYYGGQNYDVFLGCSFEGKMYLPENMTSYQALGLSTLTGDIIVPQGVTEIYDGVHENSKCTSLTLHEGILSIGNHAFRNSNIQGELVIPSTCREIRNDAFRETKITAVYLPEDIGYIGDYVFAGTRISSIQMPKSLLNASTGLFENCVLLSDVELSENTRSIGAYAFAYCYNISKFVCHAVEPPLVDETSFNGVPRDNFTICVPAESVEKYKRADGWSEFKRIAAYSDFVCRPGTACALNDSHTKTLVINADGPWNVTEIPQWCTVSQMSGVGKAQLELTIAALPKGHGNRFGKVVFTLEEKGYQTQCDISQYDYVYGENEEVILQNATNGNGIDLIFLGEGWDAESIANHSYMTLISEQVEHFFGIEPYKTYRDYFNVRASVVLSQESGINTINTNRDTKFGLIYGGGGCGDIQPHLELQKDVVLDYVRSNVSVPESKLPMSQIIIVPNSKDYGGCTYVYDDGLSISICSPSDAPYPSDTRGIIQHEAGGHGFGKLGDEMIVKNLFVDTATSVLVMDRQSRGWYQNLSLSSKMSEVPWAHFIYDPEYSDDVDIFEGAMGYTRGVYRSEQNSCMNYGIPYYNAISRQEIMRRILDYSGEGFTMEKFYATDSKEWGATEQQSRASYAQPYIDNSWHTSPYVE